MVLKLKDGRKELYQWDVGIVADVTIDNVDEVHFSNLRYGTAFNIAVKNKTVEIPPEVLQSGADVFCWAFVRGENGGYTKKEQTFNVEKRPRPADYVYEPTEILSWEALKQEIEKPITTEKISNDAVTIDKVAYNFVYDLLNLATSDDIKLVMTQVPGRKQGIVTALLANKLTEFKELATDKELYSAKAVNEILKGILINSDVQVLQELNDRTDNEPNKVYSANVINKDIIAVVTEYITKIYGDIGNINETLEMVEYSSNKVKEFNLLTEYTSDQYPNMDAVMQMCRFILETHAADVDKRLEDLKAEIQGDLDTVSVLVGGAE
jgi:hypothetical protein